MRILWKRFPLFLLAMAFAWSMPAARAGMVSLSHLGQSSAEHSMTAKGELIKVDTSEQTFTIKEENGTEVQFRYNSSTEVEGSSEGVQGLSSETGTRVTVYYKEHSGQKIASRIEIQKSGQHH